MIALYVNDTPTLIGTPKEVDDRIELEKGKDPFADIDKRPTSNCGACGSSYFCPREAASCSCHDFY